MPPAVPAHVTRAGLTAVIERDGDGFVALCPEVDVASQGSTVQEARANLAEALELFFETASESEIMRRLRSGCTGLVSRFRCALRNLSL